MQTNKMHAPLYNFNIHKLLRVLGLTGLSSGSAQLYKRFVRTCVGGYNKD